MEETQKFYENRSREILGQTSLIEYLKISEAHLDDEKQRGDKVFTWSINQEMVRCCKSEMLIKPLDTLLEREEWFLEFLRQNQYDSIKVMYRLFKDEPECLKPIG